MYRAKWLLPLILGAALVLTGCSRSVPPYTPMKLNPAVSNVQTIISNTSTGVKVSFYVGITQSSETSSVHMIYYYDATPPTDPYKPAYTAEGTYVADLALEEPVNWNDVTPGRHTFSAQLVNSANNTPLSPPVIVTNVITVPTNVNSTPEIRMMTALPSLPYPAYYTETPRVVPKVPVQITCLVNNFRLNDNAIGKQNVAGEGHLIYYLDVQPPTTPGKLATTSPDTYVITTSNFYAWEDVPDGNHIFSIQLVNNDNTPLNPPVISQITLTIPSKF